MIVFKPQYYIFLIIIPCDMNMQSDTSEDLLVGTYQTNLPKTFFYVETIN